MIAAIHQQLLNSLRNNMSGRCKSCDCVLSDDEMTAKYPETNQYIDMCFSCLSLSENSQDFDDVNYEHISIDELPESLE